MKYAALLRGINVGGNFMVKMDDLKKCFENSGFTNVKTYINSGNVIFESDEKNVEKLVTHIESTISKKFKMDLKIVLRSEIQLKKIIADIPSPWKTETDLRCYVSFIKEPITAEEAAKEIILKEGVDSIKVAKGVIYMSTKMSGIMKSGFTKLIGKKIYKQMTMRNFNTTKRILALMESE